MWEGPVPVPCPGNLNCDLAIDVDDLLILINSWGECGTPPTLCAADIAPPDGNGLVDVDDLLTVINRWGPCP
jgi:hypothetical protein